MFIFDLIFYTQFFTTNKTMRFLYFLFFLFLTYNCNSQIDTEFWFVAPEVNQNHGDRPIYLKFATYSNSSTIVVSQPANDNFLPIEFQMNANDSYVLDVTAFIDNIENKPSNTVLDYGIKIVSSSEIMVYYEVSPDCNCNPDIFALKGKNALGNFFITPFQSFNNSWSDYFAGFNIVATEDDTEVNIVLTQDSEGFMAGDEFSINLNKGQTYFVKVSNNIGNESLSGTTITSNKNIAVTVHEDSLSGSYGGCADLVGDQLIPTELLGQEYIAVKGYLYGPDKVYVTAQYNNTTVQIDGNQFATIDALETVEITLANSSAYIYTSEPSYVLHMSGFGCEVGQAILPPLDCTGSYDVSIVRSTSEFFALNILAPAGSENHFYIQGSDLTINQNDFNYVPGSNQNWLYAQLDFTNLISTNAAIRVLNSNYRFHMGLIHGGSSSGCRYGYFSDFGEFDSSFTAQTSLCEGSSLEFQAPFIEGAIYSWNGPNGFVSDIQNPIIENVTPYNQGEYSLEILLNEVCTSTSSLQIEIISRPSDFDVSEISICDYTFVDDLLLDYPNINIYNSLTLNQSLSPNTILTPGVYYITQLNEFGCESINALDVFMSCFPNIPDAFSPNNDGFNDYFNIQNLYDVFVNHKLKIYNRYGVLIFEGNNLNKWYGTTIHSNEKAPVGTYFYNLILNNSNNDIITGWVYLNH